MKTLIVEDDPLIRLSHELQIQSFGFEYTSCADATTALRVYRQTFYPLVVTDLGLPDMDGLELCRCIRSLPHGEQSIILVISGRNTPEDVQAVMDAGADDFLSKPVNSEHFSKRIAALMQEGEIRDNGE